MATSPPQSPGDGREKRSLAGEFFSMYYNTVSSIGKGSPMCQDDVDAWVMGRRHKASSGTTAWVNAEVARVSYFTYRNRLPQPIGGKLDHDAGWGCMIRTGQMMLSEALKRVFLSKVMFVQAVGGSKAADVSRTERYVRNMFMDLAEAPFGVHAFAAEGERHAIPTGTWLTPTALCRTIRELVVRQQAVSKELTVVMGLDGGISHRDICDALFLESAVLALIPIMAGMKSVGRTYQAPILRCLELPNSVGIVGGKPQRSLYFVGHQSSDVYYLDPHVVQRAFVEDGGWGSLSGPRGTCTVSSLDPCMVLCFLFFSQEEFDQWEVAFNEIHEMSDFPMFSLMKSKPKRVTSSTSLEGATAATAAPAATIAGHAIVGRPSAPATEQLPAPIAATQALPKVATPRSAREDTGDEFDDCAFDSTDEPDDDSL